MIRPLRSWLFAFSILLTVGTCAVAQELTTRDNEEVKLLARRKIELGLSDLLNVLSLADLGEAERNALISESYAPGTNQLFANKDIIVEDDISPNRAAAGTVFDMPVEKYLANFDLLYAKSAESTISFSDIAVSDLKKASSLYVKVLFTSLFRGKHTKIDKPYGPVRRVAEVRADQTGSKWTVVITRIAFATPADSVNATLNNIALKEVAPRRLMATTDSAAVRSDSAKASAVATAPPVDPEREREKAALLAYQKLLADGEAALAANDLETAQRFYEQAEKQKPIEDLTPKLRMFRIQKVLEERSRNSLVEQKKQLGLALRKRRYTEALSLAQRIADQQPDSTNLDVQRKDLVGKARRKAELDERFSAGQYRELVKEYGRLLDAERKQAKQTGDQTNLSDWLLGRGKCLTQLGEYKDALRDLNESLTVDFQNLDALESRADLYARLNDYPKAAADLSVYLTVDPANAELLARRAGYRVRTNRTTEAIADYGEALKISNQNPRYYLMRGLLFQKMGACDKAEADFTEGINRSRRQPELYFRRGVAELCLKQVAAAGADFTRANELGLDPLFKTQIDSIAASFYQQSDFSVQERRIPEALGHLATSLQLKPDFSDAWLSTGKIYYSLGDYPKSDSALTKALAYNPTNGVILYERGLTYLKMNRYAQAATDFRQAVGLSNTLQNALLGEAKALYGLRQYDQAQTTLTELLNQRKQLEKRYPATLFADAYYLSGRCAYELHKYEVALDQFEAALAMSKDWAAAYTARGRTYEAIGKPDRARDDFNRAAQLEPTVADHQLPLAILLEKREKTEEALSAYNRCQELDHDHQLASAIALGKGRCLISLGKYLEALSELNKVGQYDGLACTDECLYLRTYTQVRTGQMPANVRLSGALTKSIMPDIAPKLRYVLACAHLQADDDEQAAVQLEKALQMGIPKDFLKKDPLLDFVRKEYRKSPVYSQLVSRYR
ncbi:tetratricopeptide repeat protein [Fibrella arboris]|uniref:tetratricopeptide repeat protein n=1 Tax=Fibrella arboris TaxID=3242486 RepID=UPI003521F602